MKKPDIEARLRVAFESICIAAAGAAPLDDFFGFDPLEEVLGPYGSEDTRIELSYLIGKARAYAEAADVDVLAQAIAYREEVEASSPAPEQGEAKIDPAVQAVLDGEIEEEDLGPLTSHDKLTYEQIRAIQNMAAWRAILRRRRGAWTPTEEEAFLDGVAVAYRACKQEKLIPAEWNGEERLLDRLSRLKREKP